MMTWCSLQLVVTFPAVSVACLQSRTGASNASGADTQGATDRATAAGPTSDAATDPDLIVIPPQVHGATVMVNVRPLHGPKVDRACYFFQTTRDVTTFDDFGSLTTFDGEVTTTLGDPDYRPVSLDDARAHGAICEQSEGAGVSAELACHAGFSSWARVWIAGLYDAHGQPVGDLGNPCPPAGDSPRECRFGFACLADRAATVEFTPTVAHAGGGYFTIEAIADWGDDPSMFCFDLRVADGSSGKALWHVGDPTVPATDLEAVLAGGSVCIEPLGAPVSFGARTFAYPVACDAYIPHQRVTIWPKRLPVADAPPWISGCDPVTAGTDPDTWNGGCQFDPWPCAAGADIVLGVWLEAQSP